MSKNFYEILEITENEKKLSGESFEKVLKNNYKKLAKKWHPDRFSTKSEDERKDAEEKFKEISEAYNTLSDPQKRQEYDFKENGMNGDPFEGFNPWDIFGGRSRAKQQYKGADIQVKVKLTLEEAYHGGKKEIQYQKQETCGHCNGTGSADGRVETCPHCNGTGMVSEIRRQGNMQMMSSHPCPHCKGSGKKITKPCPKCNGKGMTNVTITETIDISRGIKTGGYITLSGKGCELPKGYDGVNGDLHVIFIIKNHDIYDVEDDDLFVDLHIDVVDAMLGCEKVIKCIDGTEVKLTIPELTKHGHTFVIKGKGMPSSNRFGDFGNCCAVVCFDLPKKLSNKQKEILRNFKNC